MDTYRSTAMLKPPKERRLRTCSFVLGSRGKHCNAAVFATSFAFRGRRHLKSPLTPRAIGALILLVLRPPCGTGAVAASSASALAENTGDDSIGSLAAFGDVADPTPLLLLAVTSSRLARCMNFIFMVSLEMPGLLAAAGLFAAAGVGSLSFFLSLLFFADFGPGGLGSPGFHSFVWPSIRPKKIDMGYLA